MLAVPSAGLLHLLGFPGLPFSAWLAVLGGTFSAAGVGVRATA